MPRENRSLEVVSDSSLWHPQVLLPISTRISSRVWSTWVGVCPTGCATQIGVRPSNQTVASIALAPIRLAWARQVARTRPVGLIRRRRLRVTPSPRLRRIMRSVVDQMGVRGHKVIQTEYTRLRLQSIIDFMKKDARALGVLLVVADAFHVSHATAARDWVMVFILVLCGGIDAVFSGWFDLLYMRLILIRILISARPGTYWAHIWFASFTFWVLSLILSFLHQQFFSLFKENDKRIITFFGIISITTHTFFWFVWLILLINIFYQTRFFWYIFVFIIFIFSLWAIWKLISYIVGVSLMAIVIIHTFITHLLKIKLLIFGQK
mgnify:CR=1 FL=1